MPLFPRRQVGFTDEPKLREDFLLPSVAERITQKSDADGIQGGLVVGGDYQVVRTDNAEVMVDDNYVVVSPVE